jgi:hypothetical protein
VARRRRCTLTGFNRLTGLESRCAALQNFNPFNPVNPV